MDRPTLRDIEAARDRIAANARVTPVYGSESLSRLVGCTVYLKAENLQRTGSFKVRGAVNKLSTLGDEQRRAGVLAASTEPSYAGTLLRLKIPGGGAPTYRGRISAKGRA